jgi:hypothetical protein
MPEIDNCRLVIIEGTAKVSIRFHDCNSEINFGGAFSILNIESTENYSR